MENILKIAAGLTFALLVQGCSSSKSLTVNSARDPLPENCRATVYAPEATKPGQYEIIATVKFGDAGFSVSCDEKAVKEAMRIEACRVGANGIIILKDKSPDLWSTCYRATAELVHIGNSP